MFRILCALLFAATALAVTLPASDPRVTVLGRAVSDGSSVAFDWSCVTLSLLSITSVTRVQVDINGGSNRFSVVVNGKRVKTFATSSSRSTYLLADGLTASAVYDIELLKETEAGMVLHDLDPARVYNFIFDQAPQLPTALPDTRKKILFLGDSDSDGYNINAPANNCLLQNPLDSESCYESYAAQISRHLNVSYHIVAQTGNGIVRAAAPFWVMPAPRLPFPEFMNRTVSSDASHVWKASSYQPNIIVIYLGGNDYDTTYPFRGPMTDAVFMPAYTQFLHTVRASYPNAAHFVNLCGGVGPQPTAPCSAIQQSVAKVSQDPAWASILSYIDLGGTKGNFNNYTCEQHRTAASQTNLASYLTPIFASLL